MRNSRIPLSIDQSIAVVIVPDRKVGCCLEPEGHGVNPGKGSEGGQGPPNREQDKQSTASKEGGSSNMEQEEEGKKSQT